MSTENEVSIFPRDAVGGIEPVADELEQQDTPARDCQSVAKAMINLMSLGHDTPKDRRFQSKRGGVRMSCLEDEVAWTGSFESDCWVCEEPGGAGPPPSVYPSV